MARLLLPLEHPTTVAGHEADDALLHALKRLPRRVQQVFLLNRLDQLDFAAIAARLDLPLASVERNMDQALQVGRSRRDVLASVAGQWYVRLQSPQVAEQGLQRLALRFTRHTHADGVTFTVEGTLEDAELQALNDFVAQFGRQWGERARLGSE